MMDGSVTVGPNAVLGFAREGYPKFSFNLHDVAEYSTFPGFWKTMFRNIEHGLKEMKNSIFKAGYLEACLSFRYPGSIIEKKCEMHVEPTNCPSPPPQLVCW
jgi:(S)-2-hydroxyglutarate dehydrogenase